MSEQASSHHFTSMFQPCSGGITSTFYRIVMSHAVIGIFANKRKRWCRLVCVKGCHKTIKSQSVALKGPQKSFSPPTYPEAGSSSLKPSLTDICLTCSCESPMKENSQLPLVLASMVHFPYRQKFSL